MTEFINKVTHYIDNILSKDSEAKFVVRVRFQDQDIDDNSHMTLIYIDKWKNNIKPFELLEKVIQSHDYEPFKFTITNPKKSGFGSQCAAVGIFSDD